MRNTSSNQKKMSIFRQDTLMPKSLCMGLKQAKYDNIIRVRTLHVPLIMLTHPLDVISKQQKIKVEFRSYGMVTTPSEYGLLVKYLLTSVKYN
jgi:hypothetical protein